VAPALAAIERAIADAAGRLRVVIVPGGGPFVDAVRALDPRVAPDDGAAHWMAILGMTQHGYLLVSLLSRGILVEDLTGIRHALERETLPVLAPYRWLRTTDPLPHRWDVTSDSIAGWVASELRAPHLLLLKSVPGTLEQLADAHLPSILRASAARGMPVRVWTAVPSDLERALLALAPARVEQPSEPFGRTDAR
jgi:aspartokinase-like uncharacterized kinase